MGSPLSEYALSESRRWYTHASKYKRIWLDGDKTMFDRVSACVSYRGTKCVADMWLNIALAEQRGEALE